MEYSRASDIRKTGLSKMITDRLVSGQSVGKSIGRSVSETIRAKGTGIKEFFDPMRMVKAATGGSSMATAIFGKMTGRSKEDIKYFTGRSKHYSKPISTSKGIKTSVSLTGTELFDPSLQSLNKIMGFMQQKRESDSEYLQTMLDYEQFNENLRQDRHDEVMEAFLEATKAKRKADVAMKKEFEKREAKYKKEIEDLKAQSKVPEVPKTKEAAEVKPSVPKQKAESVGKAEAPKPKAEPARTPSAKRSTAAKVAIAGAGALSIGQAIAQGESAKGSYNAANMGTRNNKIVPIGEKVDLENMTVGEIIRRQNIKWGDTNEKEKLFAVGKYQMIPSTLLDAVNTLGISSTERFSPTLQERMFNEYLLGVKRPAIVDYLNSPTDDPVLLKRAVKQLSLEWASIADPDIPGGKTSHYGSGNKATLSVEQAMNLLRSDREKLQKDKLEQSRVAPQVGQLIGDTSVDNAEMKKLMRQQAISVQQVIVNQNENTVVKKQTTPSSGSKEKHPLLN